MDTSNRDKTMNTLIKLNLIPYWDSTSAKAFFRNRKGSGYRNQKNRDWYDGLIEALGLYTKEDVKIVQEQMRRLEKVGNIG